MNRKCVCMHVLLWMCIFKISGSSRRYGPVFRTHLLGKPTIYSTDPEVNKFVLHNEGRLFASSYPMSLVSLLGKNSLLLTHGHLHKQLYSLTWSFTSSNVLKDHLMAEVEDIVCSILGTWACSARQEQVIHLQDEAKKVHSFAFSFR